MQQFVSPDPEALVKSNLFLELKNLITPAFWPMLVQMLEKVSVDLENPKPWYPMQVALDFCRELESRVGPKTMYSLGKRAAELRIFPASITTLSEAYTHLQEVYLTSHKGKNLGHYRLLQVDEAHRTMELEAHTPYSDAFERGLLISLARKYKSPQASEINVRPKPGVASRQDGADRTVFLITWKVF